MKTRKHIATGKRQPGRPPVITLAAVQRVGEWIGKGMTMAQSCAFEGVNPATFESAVCRRPKLKAVYERAQLKFMAAALEIIAAGGQRVMLADGEDKDGNPKYREVVMAWQGPAWLLERRHKANGQFSRMEMHVAANEQGEAVLTLTEDLQKWMQGKAAEMYVREKYEIKDRQ